MTLYIKTLIDWLLDLSLTPQVFFYYHVHTHNIYIFPRYNWKIVESGIKHHDPP
jgi:hypothetical protein